MRISTVGPLPPAPHDYMPHAKAFGNNICLNWIRNAPSNCLQSLIQEGGHDQ